MIVCKELPNYTFTDKAEMLKKIVENKADILATKRMIVKKSDAVSVLINSNTTNKALTTNPEEIIVRAVINTTNLMDSHNDVHVDGIWNKSVKESKNLYLLKEHKMSFDDIISDEITASIGKSEWSTLGYMYSGMTEALIFEAKISSKRHPYMFGQYRNGYVKNHSVGMKYVKMSVAINSDEDWAKEEKATWDKYYPFIANKSDAEELGYFFAVQEAKIIEGSAVVKGSNFATPTLSVEAVESTSTTKDEPSNGTPTVNRFNNFI